MSPDNALCLCIAGTDTDAGKTVVTAALARAAVAAGLRALVIKPVQTGGVTDAEGKLRSPDLAVCSEAAPGVDTLHLALFATACSPHLASRFENGSEGMPMTARDLAESVTRAVREWVEIGRAHV